MTTFIKNLTHHAYCLIGTSLLLQELKSALEKTHKISSAGNPDFYEKSFDSFAIDDARELITFHETRPVHSSGKKIIMVHADNMNIEAQNALLKLLEEPAEYAHFFIIIPSRHLLIPTIQSRLYFVEDFPGGTNGETNGETQKLAVNFLKANLAKRLEIAKKIADDIADEKKPRRFAIEFVNALEKSILDSGGTDSKSVKDKVKSLEAIQYVRNYMYDRAPSVKMLLEYVAMNV